MFKHLLATALLSTIAGTSPAFAVTEKMREALAQLPQLILMNPVSELAWFLDVGVLLALPQPEDETPTLQVMRGMDMAGILRPMEALGAASPEPWEERAGIGIESVRYLAGFGDAPYTISVWGLMTEAAVSLPGRLERRGFAAAGENGALANGVPMQMNLAEADPADPWSGRMGQAFFVKLHDEVVIQSPTPEGLTAVAIREGAKTAADTSIVQTALGGLDATVEGEIVQAILISPAFGLGQIDPAAVLRAEPGNIDSIRAELEAQMAEAARGIPAYLGGVIADLQVELRPALAVSLAYPDCGIAEAAGAAVAERWREHPDGSAPVETHWQAVPGSEGLCAATIVIESEVESAALNPIVTELLSAYRNRTFNLLQIGNRS